MKKSYLISIQPQWLEKILNGQKTIEVRRKVNKDVLDKLDKGETVEAYLYCTKGKPLLVNDYYRDKVNEVDWEVVNRFRLVNSTDYLPVLNGTIPVKVVIDGYERLEYHKKNDVLMWDDNYYYYTKDNVYNNLECLLDELCLEHQQVLDYGNEKDLYALHISKVEILDEVMGLDDFVSDKLIVTVCGDEPKCYSDTAQYYARKDQTLKRPPQNCMSVWVK